MAVRQKDRIEFIDLAKGICIIFVVMIHAVPSLDAHVKVLPYIRMPLYFCLSGLFYKDYGSFKNFTIKKVNNILIPFVAWYVIGAFIYFVGRLFFAADHEDKYFFGDVLFQNEIYNQPVWFLLSLFWSNILFSLVNLITKKSLWQFLIVTLLAAFGISFNYFKIFNFLYIGIALTSMPFFFLGYMLKKTALLYPSNSQKRDFFIMGVFLVLALFLTFFPDNPPRIIYYNNKLIGSHVEIYYFAGLFFVVSLLLMSKFFKTIPFVSWLGRYSIIVLVSHMLLINLFRPALRKLTSGNMDYNIECLLVLILVFLSMFFIIPFCKKFLPHITAQKPVFPINEKKHKNNQKTLE